MTQEEFNEWLYVDMPSSLFHVMPTDLDDKYGVRIDELTLVQMINQTPEVLKFKSLSWLVEHFINESHSDDCVEVKAKYEGMSTYKEWTKVSRMLAMGLQGVDVREI